MQILGLLVGMYVLCCCGSICHEPFTIIHIGPGHTVMDLTFPLLLFVETARENMYIVERGTPHISRPTK